MNEKKSGNRFLLICGGITLLCVLLLLLSLLLSRKQDRLPGESGCEEPAAGLESTESFEYLDSSEYAASAAWEHFRAGYDKDGSILAAALNDESVEAEGPYELYFLYSPEMTEKFEEILGQYPLRLHESISFCYSAEELYAAAGTGAFLPLGDCGGYVYDDLSFHADGSLPLSGSRSVDYRLDRHSRGVFSEESLPVGVGSQYQCWNYTGQSAVPLRLAMGPEDCIIHCARPESFVSVVISCGAVSEENPLGLSSAGLEQLAESFSWNEIP